MAFPELPVDGQIYKNYIYDEVFNVWKKYNRINISSDGTLPTIGMAVGDECYDTSTDRWLKYNGSVWIQI